MSDLLNTLNACARLRGVEMLPWRTLHEFNHFVQYCIFENDPNANETLKRFRLVAKENEITDCDDSLILEKFADLFQEYCMEIYLE